MAKFLNKVNRTLTGVASMGYSEYNLYNNKQAEKQRSQQITESAEMAKAAETKNQSIVDANFGDLAKKKGILTGRSGGGKSLYSSATQSGLYTV